MNKFFLLITLLTSFSLSAQVNQSEMDNAGNSSDTTETEAQTVFLAVDQMPEYPGGNQAMAQFLMKNIVYPDDAMNYGVEGKVYLTFTVDSIGRLGDIKTIRGIGYGCEEEAIRVLKLMPNWNPGKQDGKPVSVRFHLPLRFTFPQDEEDDTGN